MYMYLVHAVEASALDEVNEVKQFVGNEMANRCVHQNKKYVNSTVC